MKTPKARKGCQIKDRDPHRHPPKYTTSKFKFKNPIWLFCTTRYDQRESLWEHRKNLLLENITVSQMWWLSCPWPQQSGRWLLWVWGQHGLPNEAVSQKGKGKGGKEERRRGEGRRSVGRGTKKMGAQLGKCPPCKHQDLTFSPRTWLKNARNCQEWWEKP